MDELANILWAYRTTPKMTTGESPFSLCYGAEAVLPTEIIADTPRQNFATTPEKEKALAFKKDILEGHRDKSFIHMTNY